MARATNDSPMPPWCWSVFGKIKTICRPWLSWVAKSMPCIRPTPEVGNYSEIWTIRRSCLRVLSCLCLSRYSFYWLYHTWFFKLGCLKVKRQLLKGQIVLRRVGIALGPVSCFMIRRPQSMVSPWQYSLIAACPVRIRMRKAKFFRETFLLADISADVVLGMPFLTFTSSNTDVRFSEQ